MKTLLAPILAIVLITGLVYERSTWPQPEDVEGYHRTVAEAIRAIPSELETWTSTEIELPMAAVAMLRPNEIFSRHYVDEATGRSVQMLIVHCRDARDMIGHYPPVCYPANGWDLRQRREQAWQLETMPTTVEGMTYEFEQLSPGAARKLHVTNLIVLPDGAFGHSMSDVNRIAADRKFRVYGAAQVQFVFAGHFTESERDQIVEFFTAAATPAVQAIRNGVQR